MWQGLVVAHWRGLLDRVRGATGRWPYRVPSRGASRTRSWSVPGWHRGRCAGPFRLSAGAGCAASCSLSVVLAEQPAETVAAVHTPLPVGPAGGSGGSSPSARYGRSTSVWSTRTRSTRPSCPRPVISSQFSRPRQVENLPDSHRGSVDRSRVTSNSRGASRRARSWTNSGISWLCRDRTGLRELPIHRGWRRCDTRRCWASSPAGDRGSSRLTRGPNGVPRSEVP